MCIYFNFCVAKIHLKEALNSGKVSTVQIRVIFLNCDKAIQHLHYFFNHFNLGKKLSCRLIPLCKIFSMNKAAIFDFKLIRNSRFLISSVLFQEFFNYFLLSEWICLAQVCFSDGPVFRCKIFSVQTFKF